MNTGNYFTKTGAEKLAGKIRSYWTKRGYEVDVRVESFVPWHDDFVEGKSVFCVRSDMVNGMPQRRLAGVKEAA